jgi:hypothetical protein
MNTKQQLNILLNSEQIDFNDFLKITDLAVNELQITDKKQWLKDNYAQQSRYLLSDELVIKLIQDLHDLLPDEPSYLIAVNGYKDGFIGENIIYLGRHNEKLDLKASPLANPFKMGIDGTRDEIINKYRKWLFDKIKKKDSNVMGALNMLKLAVLKKMHKKLACYCNPEPCHVDVVIKAVYWLIEQDKKL